MPYLISTGLLHGQNADEGSPINLQGSNDGDKQTSHINIRNLKSNRSFTINQGQHVRMYCHYKPKVKKGKSAKYKKTIKSGTVDIHNHRITFQPSSQRFDSITYSDSTLAYIEFVTVGSLVGGVVLNSLIMSTIVVIAVIGRGSVGPNIRMHNFHKHIKVHNRRMVKVWAIKAV